MGDDTSVYLIAPGVTTGSALVALARYLAVPVSDAAAVGDGRNDPKMSPVRSASLALGSAGPTPVQWPVMWSARVTTMPGKPYVGYPRVRAYVKTGRSEPSRATMANLVTGQICEQEGGVTDAPTR